MAVAAGGLRAATGCTTHQCDSDMVCIDSTGSMKTISDASECTPIITGGTKLPFYNLDVWNNAGALFWETSSLLGPWLDFPGQRTYIINLPPGLAGQRDLAVFPYVSSDNAADMEAGAPHMNYTPASGQLTEFTNAGTSLQLSVVNATCVGYGLRLVVSAHATGSDDGDGSTAPGDAAVAE